MAHETLNPVQRFFLHQPPGLRPYISIVNKDRHAFDFSDNTFKPASQLATLADACSFATGRYEDRADYGYSYSVEFDLARLLECGIADGAIVSVYWLVQQESEPNPNTDRRSDICRFRIAEGKIELVDSWSRDQLDENIAFEARAKLDEEYRAFVLREIDSQGDRRRRLSEAVGSGDVGATLRVLAEDLRYWAGNLKEHFFHQLLYSAKDSYFVRMINVPNDKPFRLYATWIIRDWIGAHEAFDLLEFHKSSEYAQGFSARLDRLHEARVKFAEILTQYTAKFRDDDPEGMFALDEIRKDLKHKALWQAEHLDRIARQFDAERGRSLKKSDIAPTQSIPPEPHRREPAVNYLPQPFVGGEMVFFPNRVELCGADICSGPRSQTRRRILELLGKRRTDGTFVAFSGDKLAAELKSELGRGTVAGAIRDLRDDIIEALRNQANIICGQNDVILSRGVGYRFADCVDVRLDGSVEPNAVAELGGLDSEGAELDAGPHDMPDEQSIVRRTWILDQLAIGAKLKRQDVVRQFSCSPRTAQRDLTSLKDEGKIEFVGAARTGYYRLCLSNEFNG